MVYPTFRSFGTRVWELGTGREGGGTLGSISFVCSEL
jgi:hypothetical protein